MTMEQVKTLSEESAYYVPPIIRHQLLKAKNDVLKKNQDRVYVVDGREGVGKSTLTVQLANILDEVSIENIVFKSEDFENTLRELKPGSAIIFDEAFNGLSSKGALSKQNKKLVRLLMECRQRNLFIFIVLPTIFLLERYVAIFRSQCLFHAYISNGKRYYKVYNYSNKKRLYIKGKGLMSYHYPHIKKSYRFYGKFPQSLDIQAYLKKKLDSFRDIEKNVPEESKVMKQRNTLLKYVVENYSAKYTELSNVLNTAGCELDPSSIGKICRDTP